MTVLQDALKASIKGSLSFDNEIEEKLLTDFVGSHIGHAEAYVKAQDENDIQVALKIAYQKLRW